MKRAAAAFFGTVVGLVLLLGYKSAGRVQRRLVSPTQPALPTVPTDPTTAPPDPSGGPTTTTAPTTTPTGTRTVTGPDEPNRFGDVQVQLTINNGRITDVQALRLPFDRSRSAEISQYAGPILGQEVIAAQGANIDVVSGATYTSEGYAASVQAALDQARS
jgi:uncharacterized protein with FMN-binding domain